MDREIIASVAGAWKADTRDAGQMTKLKSAFVNPSLQMISFTITEKGYALFDLHGELLPAVKRDMAEGHRTPEHPMSIVAAMLLERYRAGGFPIAVVSMDNCSHNGETLFSSIMAVARAWEKNGFVDGGFLDWLGDERKISFPWSMIDKITPRPDETILKSLDNSGISGMAPIITGRGTFIAPFVNAEIPQYLVIEDKFPNGRPLLERAGVYFTDRETVNKSEKMKVCTCLNPLHTALAIYGCLLGFTSIAAEMRDAELAKLVERIGAEGIPVAADPGIIRPADFIREVIDRRFPNPFVPDTPQRIATDTSQKIVIRFGETIKNYLESDVLDINSLIGIPLAIAGWMRYLLAVDDSGKPMELSGDPLREELQNALRGIRLGYPDTYTGQLQSILKKPVLFGADLCAAGLFYKIERMFCELIEGPGAVRQTLQRYTRKFSEDAL